MQPSRVSMVIALLVSVLLIQGCVGHGGRRFAWDKHGQIIEKKSNTDDVVALLGKPLRTKDTTSGPLWEYAFAKAVAVPFGGAPKTSVWSLAIKFDQNGIVEDTKYSERHGVKGGGVVVVYTCPKCGEKTQGVFCSACGARFNSNDSEKSE